MTNDPYKGMVVSYNFLNLPTQMQFGNAFTGTKTIDVLYDASGHKLRKTVTNGTTLQYRQDYVGGIEYRSTSTVSLSLESIYHPEGRVFNTNSGTTSADALRYEYSIKDHLGNTRLNFTDKNGDGKVDVTTTTTNEILSESHYYPFGMVMSGPWMDDAARDNQYKYNGKELNEDFGLGWYDYGARWYDASLGRWNVVDPLAEKYSGWSGYNYVMGNPVKLIDPDGNQSENIIIEQRRGDEVQSAKRTFEQLQNLSTQKLSMDKSGRVTIVEGEGNKNASTESTQMISDIINDHSATVTITNDISRITPPPNLGNNAVTTAENDTNAENGNGSSSEISFSPDVKATFETTDCKRVAAPPERVLAHELIHADNIRTGSRQTQGEAEGNYRGNREEQKAIQRENLMFKTQRYDGTNNN